MPYKDPEKERASTRERTRRYRERIGRDEVNRRARVYREQNPEAQKKSSKTYREKNREALKTKLREYRTNNQEKISERRAEYYAENRESLLEKASQHHYENPSLRKAAESRRQERLIPGGDSHGLPWTKAEDALLTRSTGTPKIELALLLGRSESAVANRLHRLRYLQKRAAQ